MNASGADMGALRRATAINTRDPMQRHRIQVALPDEAARWVEACLPPGILTLPEPGDTVWLAREFGTGEYVWVGVVPVTRR